MEWFVLLAPLPAAAVDASATSGATLVTTLMAALTPALLALRQTLRKTAVAPDAPQLRVIEGGKELGRRAA
jgi:hypothetical protein